MNATLAQHDGKVLWSNPNMVFREQYQESVDPASFFEEEAPAVQRMARMVSKQMVADVLEAF
jgi:hypothetical protein